MKRNDVPEKPVPNMSNSELDEEGRRLQKPGLLIPLEPIEGWCRRALEVVACKFDRCQPPALGEESHYELLMSQLEHCSTGPDSREWQISRPALETFKVNGPPATVRSLETLLFEPLAPLDENEHLSLHRAFFNLGNPVDRDSINQFAAQRLFRVLRPLHAEFGSDQVGRAVAIAVMQLSRAKNRELQGSVVKRLLESEPRASSEDRRKRLWELVIIGPVFESMSPNGVSAPLGLEECWSSDNGMIQCIDHWAQIMWGDNHVKAAELFALIVETLQKSKSNGAVANFASEGMKKLSKGELTETAVRVLAINKLSSKALPPYNFDAVLDGFSREYLETTATSILEPFGPGSLN